MVAGAVMLEAQESTVRASAQELVAQRPGLYVHGIVGDVERHLDHLPEPAGPRILAFLGGMVGNLLPGAQRRVLRDLAGRLRPEDHLLLGTDLVKDRAMLEAACNDAAGVTAAFTLNLLSVMNRELGADFDRDREWVGVRLQGDHAAVGLELAYWLTDPRGLYAVTLARPR